MSEPRGAPGVLSRPLVVVAAAAFALAGLAPIAAMLARLAPGDFSGLLDERTLGLLGRTLLLGGGSAGIALALGLPFGFLVARTDVPAAALLRPLGLVPLLLPPLFIAMTWTAVLDVRGAGAAIAVLGAGTFPIVALFTARAGERIDAGQEEAALLVGGLRAVLRTDLPIVLPAALSGTCFAFLFAVHDFAVPDFVTAVSPEKFNVYADEVFSSWRVDKSPGHAVAVALPLVLLSLGALVPALALRRRGARASISPRFRSPSPLALGRARLPALLFCAAVVGLAALVPLGRLLWESGGGPRGFSHQKMRAAFGYALETARGDVANSLVFASCAATLAVPIALVLGHALERARRGPLFTPLVLLPIAVPAVLFGIGMIVTWNHAATAAFYDGGGIVVLLFVGRYLAFPLLVVAGAVALSDPRCEDAARLAGAGPARRLARIVSPPLLPALAGAWVLVFVLALRELDAAILVPAANHTAIFRVYNAVHFGRDDFVAALALLLVFFLVLPGLLWALFAHRRLEVLP